MLSTLWTYSFIPTYVWNQTWIHFFVMGFLATMGFRMLAPCMALHGGLGITSRNHARSDNIQHSSGYGYYCHLWPDGSGPYYQIVKKKILLCAVGQQLEWFGCWLCGDHQYAGSSQQSYLWVYNSDSHLSRGTVSWVSSHHLPLFSLSSSPSLCPSNRMCWPSSGHLAQSSRNSLTHLHRGKHPA